MNFIREIRDIKIFSIINERISLPIMIVGGILFGAFICTVLMKNHVDAAEQQIYEPNWKSLDSRPLPQWYDKAKIGIFLHWGVYSVPTTGSEWFWNHWRDRKSGTLTNYMRSNFKPGFTYQEFAPQFTAEHFNPSEWAQLFEESGAK